MPYIVFILGFTVFMPIGLAFISGGLRKKQFEKFDNNNPRQQMLQLKGAAARALAAQQNAWEAAILFIGSVFVANLRGVPLENLTLAGGVFLIARILHAVCYLIDFATLRSLSFGVALFSCLYIAFIA